MNCSIQLVALGLISLISDIKDFALFPTVRDCTRLSTEKLDKISQQPFFGLQMKKMKGLYKTLDQTKLSKL